MTQPDLTALRVRDLLDQLASGEPTPVGGAAAALAGALAASLIGMACNLTVGREKFADVEAEVREILRRADELRARLSQGVSADAAAYSGVIAARGLPRGDDPEKARRAEAIQVATREAARVPLEVAEDCAAVLGLCESAVRITNPHTISDVAVAALLAEAGLHGALMSVEINLASIKDERFAADARRRVAAVTADPRRAARIRQQARERI